MYYLVLWFASEISRKHNISQLQLELVKNYRKTLLRKTSITGDYASEKCTHDLAHQYHKQYTDFK